MSNYSNVSNFKFENLLEEINKLKIYTFQQKNINGLGHGLLENEIPENLRQVLVQKDPRTKVERLDYFKLSLPLIQAIQEIQIEQKNQNKRINVIEEKIIDINEKLSIIIASIKSQRNLNNFNEKNS